MNANLLDDQQNPEMAPVSRTCGRRPVSVAESLEYGYRHAEVMHEARIVRLSADGKVEKELPLEPPCISKRRNPKTGEFFRQPELRLRLAADFSVPERPVLWVGVTAPAAWYCAWGLLRIEDLATRSARRRTSAPTTRAPCPPR